MRRNLDYKPAIAAAVICLLVYLRTLGNDFIYIDDPTYVYNNPEIRSWDCSLILSAFTRIFAGDYWMPLTWLSFAIDYRFWGLDPTGYHLTNALWHSINVALLVLVIAKLVPMDWKSTEMQGGGRGDIFRFLTLFMAGLLWGIHPLRTESVAWVMARKDVLNGAFTLGALLCYIIWVQQKGGRRGSGYYLGSLLLFACSLMAKPVSVVLPLLLLIMDWYPLKRFATTPKMKLLLEKVPFAALSVGITVVTILAKLQYGGLQSVDNLPWLVRLVLSGNAVWEYLRMTVWPIGIVLFYPLPKPIPPAFMVNTAIVSVITILLLLKARSWPPLSAGWFAFVILLLPVLAFMHNGIDIAFASRFTYLAAIVPSVAAAGGMVAWQRRFASSPRWQHGVAVLVSVVLICYVGITNRLISAWKDTGTLWTRQIEVRPLGRAYNARGHYYLIRDRYADAIRDFSTAIEIAVRQNQPFVDNLYAFRGEAYLKSGLFAPAVDDFSAAIALNPHPRYFYHRGLAFSSMGERRRAEEDVSRASGDNGPIVWFPQGEH